MEIKTTKEIIDSHLNNFTTRDYILIPNNIKWVRVDDVITLIKRTMHENYPSTEKKLLIELETNLRS